MSMQPFNENQDTGSLGIGPADPGTAGSHPNGRSSDKDGEKEQQTIVVQQVVGSELEWSPAAFRLRFQTHLAVVWRYWPAGITAAALLAGIFVWYMTRNPVKYEAVTTFLAQNPLEKLILDASPEFSADLGENSLKNHISVMTSRNFMLRLSRAFTPTEEAAILEPYQGQQAPPSVAEIIATHIKAERERGREFFKIKAFHQSRDVALLLAERFVSEYRRVIHEEVLTARRSATLYLRERATEFAGEIKQLEDERRAYREKYNLVSVGEHQGGLAERMRRTNLALSEVKLERLRYENVLKQAAVDLARTPTPFDNPNLARYGNNSSLRIELDRLGNQRAQLAARFGPNHPAMKEADRNIASVEAMLASGFRLAYEDLEIKHQLALDSEAQLNNEVTEIFTASLELDRLVGGFKRLTDELIARQQAQSELLGRISLADVNSDVPADTLRTVDAPFLTGANTSRRALLVLGTIVVFLGSLVGVPLGLYAMTDRVTGSMDVESEFKLGLLGVIPRLRAMPDADRPHIVRDNIDLEQVESFLTIAAQLDLSSEVPYPKRVLVTSSVPGEGKSMLASNLASTFTRYGRKTVLVDFDFRRPTQQDIHDMPDDRGFLSWAAADCPTGPNAFEAGGALGLTALPDGTWLIPTGGVHAQPGGFLVARTTTKLFDQLSLLFDVVVVDSPPAALFQDALILARYCQETVIVVREGRPHRTQIKKMLADLQHLPTHCAGIVLNGFSRRTTHPSLAYRYAAYGKYSDGYWYDRRYHPDGQTTHSKGSNDRVNGHVTQVDAPVDTKHS